METDIGERIGLAMKIRIATVWVALGVVGQTLEPSTALEAQVRDSAGIRIIENARPADGSRLRWRIGRGPAVSIGEREGADPYMFFIVSDATRLTDGRIVVVNRGTTELRVFDAAGTYLDTWGGKGEGPGEFSDVLDIEPLPGDSVLVWALMHPTVTVFDANGIPARTFPSRRRLSDESWHFVLPAAVAGDASILAVQNQDFFETDSVAVELWDAEGGLRSSLGVHPARPHHVIEDRVRYRRIFGLQLAVEPWGDLIVISPTDRYEIHAHAKDGTLARIVRLAHVPRPPTRAHVEAFIERKIAALPMQARAGERRLWEAVPVAEHMPPIASVMADALHNLWVEEYEVPGEEVPGVLWTVFDPAGRVLGFVETPDGLKIHEIGEDYILGVTQDEFDVQYVQMWSLERSGG